MQQEGGAVMFRWMRQKPLQNKAFSVIGIPFDALMETDAPDYRGIPTLQCPCGYSLMMTRDCQGFIYWMVDVQRAVPGSHCRPR